MEYIQESNMEVSCVKDINFIKRARQEETVLCARALIYEKETGLHFNLGSYKAIMPTDQVIYSPGNEPVKEAAIVTRINKKVCFVVTGTEHSKGLTTVYISRKKLQKKVYEEYISQLRPGDVIPCTVTRVDSFGVFCDVACGINALLPIDFISVSRINSPADRFYAGQNIYACIKSIDSNGRIVLSHKELLGTWLENAEKFTPQTTVTGIVRSIESYGVFVELAPNLAGLAEPCEGVKEGDAVNVFIKSILPDKMKIKLVIMDIAKDHTPLREPDYFITSGHIDHWRYSTRNCRKQIFTNFE
ncbi:MAG: 30S ribosomal protein S1 [Oscillospiraceae bacterium]|nr:30S ribosomal protein S1 [Oscillospiraceae bacterium]